MENTTKSKPPIKSIANDRTIKLKAYKDIIDTTQIRNAEICTNKICACVEGGDR